MKKIRTSRGVAILLCLCMALAVLVGALTIPVRATAGNSTITEQELLEAEHPDALHFYIRHWHDKEDSRTTLQGVEQQSGDRYFVVAEGYIVPLAEGDKGYEVGKTEYAFYLVYQSGSEGHSEGDLLEIDDGDDDDNFVNGTDYIEAVDAATGAITLKASPVPEWDEDGSVLKNEDGSVVSTERFSAFSISAGHDAVTYGPANGFTEDTLTITYDKYVHLVKGHVFYISDVMDVAGTNDSRVFGINGMGELEDPEVDTVEIWAYARDIENDEGEVLHAKGSFVEDSSTDPAGLFGSAYTAAEVAKAAGVDQSDIKLTKFYSTADGLHTDKTAAVVGDDGRTFDVTLETWYTEKHPANVGMVLDASGSMVFASDEPSVIHLTDAQIQNLKINRLTEDPNDNGGWEEYFLTDEQLNQILNPRNTDNSKLSASGYSYFVFVEDGTNGKYYGPLGYWEGVPTQMAQLTFTNSTSLPQMKDDSGNDRSWLYDSVTGGHASRISPQVAGLDSSYEFKKTSVASWPSGDLKFTSSNGLQVGSYLNHSGVLLDAQPTGGDFTLAFDLVKNTSGSGLIEMLYIGPMSSESTSGYYRLYYDADKDQLCGSQNSSDVDAFTSVANNATKHNRVTLVFKNADTTSGTVTMYIDGESYGTADLKIPITDANIIIAGVASSYTGGGTDDLDIDEFVLYNAAVSAGQVAGLGSTDVPTIATTADGKILGLINTDNSNYFTNGNNTAVTKDTFKHTQAGWYFITHSGRFNNLAAPALGTAKRLVGLNGTQTSKVNNVDVKGIIVSDTITVNDTTIDGSSADTNYTYTNTTSDTPTKFYVDKEGNLRCFVSSSNNASVVCSYVYELTDKQYIRTETLQRAIGSFVTELEQKSPDAWVSAVRFSTSDFATNTSYKDVKDGQTLDKHLAYQVIQKWTNDAGDSAGMLSLLRGDGGAMDEDNGQYNYAMTGSTSTYLGLQTFIDNLAELPDEREGGRFLIIFTDGLDGSNSQAVTSADTLKDMGYTIFTVLLDGGSMNDDDYNTAHNFLLKLAGNNQDGTNPEDYFFSVKKAKDEGKTGNDADILTQIFSKDILDQVAEDRIDYTVQDYIDPRFDLVDGDGVTWYLKTGGQVKLSDGTTHTLDDTNGVKFTLKGASTQTVKDTAYLFYDAEVDMYYFEWLDQRIPACAIGSSELSVWSATFTLKAKEDFIGGNDVLTNGNKEYMNWVYYPDDAGRVLDADGNPLLDADGNEIPNYSSGTDDMYVDYVGDTNIISDHPSKGFPRVTVNVKTLEISEITSSENRIYLGEVIDPMEAIKQLGDTLDRDDYWVDYLRRYAPIYAEEHGLQGAENMTAEELLDYLLEELIKRPNDWGFDIPYYYLADPTDPTSQAGLADQQQSDQLGILHYRWERIDPDSGQVIGVGGYGAGSSSPSRGEVYETLDTRRIEYRLVISYWPFPDKNDDFWKGLDTWQAGQNEKVKNGETVKFATVTDFLDTLRDGLDGKGGLSSAVQSASSRADLNAIIATLEGFMGDAPTAALEEEQFAQHRKDILYHLFGSEDGPDGDVDEDYESLVKLFGELAELRSALAETTDSERRANLQAQIAQKESDLDAKKSEVDVLIQDMVNYVNYLRWCYGYEETTDPETDVSSGGYTDGSKKFNSRVGENTKLIKSSVTASDDTVLKAGDDAYLTPKPPVGEAQYNRVANGNLLTRVVRGELAFEMEFQLFELDYLFSQFWTDRTEMTYTVNVERMYEPELSGSTYKDGKWLEGLTIPDLTITITPEDIAKLEDPEGYPDEVKVVGGVVTLYYETTYTDGTSKYLYPKAIYNTRTGDVTFYSDPTVFDPEAYTGAYEDSDYARLLPIGTYKLTPDTEANSAAGWDVFNFGDGLLYAPQSDYTFNNWHFTRTEDGTEPTNTTDSVYFPRSKASLDYGFGQIYAPAANWATVTDAEGNTSEDPKGTLADKDGGVVFLLGTGTVWVQDMNDDGTPKVDANGEPVMIEVRVADYTDDRVGMAKLTASLKYLLPATGGSGTTVFYASGAALLLVGSLCLVCLDLRTRRTRRQAGTRS